MPATMQLPAHACDNTFSGEPDAGKSACPVRRGESGSHRKVSPSLLLYRQAGLVTGVGYDAYVRRIVIPLEGNLYGRSISAAAPPHRFLPGAKGGLYAWEQARRYPEVILVEGLFDYAVLWQDGLHNVTCAMGTHLNARQFQQLCDGPRTVYLGFDADANGSGAQASQQLADRLGA